MLIYCSFFIYFFLFIYLFLQVNFESNYVMLSQEHAEHINKRHVVLDKNLGAFKFLWSFNLASTVAYLTRKTFLHSDDYEIIEEGYKAGHGYYYMYVFKIKKVVGVCPWAYPTTRFASTSLERRHTEINSASLGRIYSPAHITFS